MEIQQREQEWYEKVRQFVVSSFTEAGKISKSNHLIRTAALVKILEPHADTMLLTAALSHDIEKAYRSHESLEQKEKFGLVDPRFLRIHEER
jgi:predicted HD phosphohydrolase